MTLIEDIVIRKILDSRGNPTVEVEVYTLSGYGRAAAPAGKSTGIHEVKAYPAGGIDAGIKYFKERMENLMGMDATRQEDIDAMLHEIDGTQDFSMLGGNIAVAVSLAVAKAAANSLGLPFYQYLGGVYANMLPKPVGNVLGEENMLLEAPPFRRCLRFLSVTAPEIMCSPMPKFTEF